MKYTSIPTLIMLIGSSIGASLLAQESVPATPIIPAASTEAATTDTKTAEVVTDQTAPSATSQIESATKAYDKKYNEFTKKLRAEKDRDKQRKLYEQHPKSTSTVDLILTLAKENPKAEGVEQGLAWSVRRGNTQQRKEVEELLLTHYKDSEALGKLAYMYSRTQSGGDDELRAIIEKSGNEKVRQGATYYLASKLTKKEESKAEGVAMMKKLQQWPKIAETNPKLLEQINGEIFVTENLSVGCEAPDIVGTDHEGKEFKLSDFKGKVVLLDFWGIW